MELTVTAWRKIERHNERRQNDGRLAEGGGVHSELHVITKLPGGDSKYRSM